MRLLITRPQADAEPLRAALSDRGHDGVIAPLLEIVALPDAKLDLSQAQALIITSANGARALTDRTLERDLPVYAVGDASARAAREIGLTSVESANGDISDLARLIQARARPQDGHLVHIAGSKIAGDLAGMLQSAGLRLNRAVLYEARSAERLPPVIADALAENKIDGGLFFSPRTARSFVNLVRAADLTSGCENLLAFCLSPAVATEVKRLSWRQVVIASAPTQAALLDAIAEMNEST